MERQAPLLLGRHVMPPHTMQGTEAPQEFVHGLAADVGTEGGCTARVVVPHEPVQEIDYKAPVFGSSRGQAVGVAELERAAIGIACLVEVR
ncbi:MAG: hypothetical protein GY772_19905 [bacterium]|nr:hypothetical protein [bacterium]